LTKKSNLIGGLSCDLIQFIW